MALEKVREYFKQFGLNNRILEFNESTATVELAAKAVGTAPEQIAKTLSFLVNEKPILIVFSGDCRVDNQKFKQEFQTKAKMVPYDLVENLIGHGVGGVCPFAINFNVQVYLDESLKRFDVVYPACGSDNSAIGLSIQEMEKYSGYIKWVDVSRY